ncbi:MAG TPA: FHA domain-containing protein [Polyangia bacterium]|jgi:hypothetical protein|nr:FHA domain-containing protein [Polyangia bacterium]
MSIDERSKTTLRQFHCRDRLWHTFEQISEEQDKSVEELINDAMSSYAQLAGYETAVNVETPGPTPLPVASAPLARSGRALPAVPPPPRMPPMPPRFGRATAAAVSSAMPPAVEDALAGATLYLVFDNQKYRIDKDQFIIGRGSKSSDLPIKDGNVSRKHAAVIRRNGAYFIKDLGSTNGIDFKGMRIDNKRIDEGDVFHICEYELKFTYKR